MLNNKKDVSYFKPEVTKKLRMDGEIKDDNMVYNFKIKRKKNLKVTPLAQLINESVH